MGNTSLQTLSLKVPAQLAARVSRLAARRATTRSALIREAIEAFADAQETGGTPFGEAASRYAGALKRAPADLSTHPRHLKGFGQ